MNPTMHKAGSTNPEPTTGEVGGLAGTAQDLQRVALHDLVALAGECAAKEAEIERRFRSAAEANDAEFRKISGEIDRRRDELIAEFHARHEEFLSRIEAQHEADLGKLDTSDKTARRRIETDHAATDRDVKKKLAQAAWLADTVLESTQNQIRADAKQAREEYSARRKALRELEEHAAAVMLGFGQEWPAPAESAETSEAAASAEKTPQANPEIACEMAEESIVSFDDRCALAHQYLDMLADLRLPRVTSGILPFLAVVAGFVATAGIVQLVSATRVPQWKAMGIAAGLAAAAMIVVSVMLRRKAIGQVWNAAMKLRAAIDQASAVMEAEYRRATESQKARQAEAVAKREKEIRDAKAHFAPLLSQAAHAQAEAIRAVDEERTRLLPLIEGQRERALMEVEEWRGRREAELRQGYENECQSVRERYERRAEEIHRQHENETRELARRWTEGLAHIQAPIDGNHSEGGVLFPSWDAEVWRDWRPPKRFTSTIRFGEFRVDLKQITKSVPRHLELPGTFSVPALLAFPRQASLLLHADQAGRPEALQTLQTVMMRLLTCLPPGRVRFTIIDPTGLGQNFAGFMHLADHDEALVGGRIWTSGEHIEQRLADLTEHMETVIQKYLRNEFETIDDYNEQAGELAEPYRFLVIADFPANFSDIAVQRLNSIASTGARCGVYTLVARDTRIALPSGTHIDELQARSVNLLQQNGRFAWNDTVFKQFPLSLEKPPAEDFLTRILNIVGRYAKDAKRVEVPFATIAPKPEEFWSGSTKNELSVPIGKMGATRLQSLRLGRGVAQHGLIAGKTGSGKSTLLHALITNLAMWYSPDEVEFYLVDFKKGVEFKAYATHLLPHARAIAVESDREFGLSVLQRVDAELARRGEAFRKLGVQDLASYRETSGHTLPRTLLIIDEFQEFFSEDDKLAQDAGLLLDRLVRQGRAFGIHVLLGSQTIGGTSGLARSTIGQMAVRVALQTSEADSQIILGDGNAAARLLSRPGEAIYNDAGGLVEANSPFQVAWLPDDHRDEFLSRIQAKTRESQVHKPEPVVFEGNVPADITRNPLLTKAIEAPSWPEPTTAPRVWIGEPVAIKDPTGISMRRQSGSNILVVGQDDEAALDILGSAMISLAAQLSTEAASFVVLDGTPADSPLAGVFEILRSILPHEVRLTEYRSAGDVICELADEMRRRQAAEITPEKGIYVFIYGLQRYRVLRKQEDSFSFSMNAGEEKPNPDRQFADLLREGAPLGMHVIVWCDTPAVVERTFDRNSLREFDNRVLFQMSASDSSNLIDSPLANKLGTNRALAYSEEQGVVEKFRPYALPGHAWLKHVQEQLGRRKTSQ